MINNLCRECGNDIEGCGGPRAHQMAIDFNRPYGKTVESRNSPGKLGTIKSEVQSVTGKNHSRSFNYSYVYARWDGDTHRQTESTSDLIILQD